MALLNDLNRKIDTVYDYFGHYYLAIIFWFHVVYFAVIFGIVTIDIYLLNSFNIFIHTMVCIFLIARFNPLRDKNTLRPTDSQIIFSSSLFLLLNMSVIEFVKKYFPSLSSKLKDVKVIV
jgi:hypothetical protein